MHKRRVAVTGMGVVACNGLGVPQFWDALVQSRSGIGAYEVVFASGAEPVIMGRVDFEPKQHFNTSQLLTMDRTSQLGMIAAHEAMRQACLVDAAALAAHYDVERCDVMVGTGMGGAVTMEASYQALLTQGANRLRPMTVVMCMNNALAAQASMHYKLLGKSNTITNACASSANAIGEGIEQIQLGMADMALCGGAESLLTTGVLKAWQAMQTLAHAHKSGTHAACRPFDTERTGLVLAEGAAMLVLEEMESAKRRGATILAELVAYGTSTDAHHLTQPQATGQARAMRQALVQAEAVAGLQSTDIGYINAHGTATQVGDTVECEAIAQVFEAHSPPMSSTKALHGHAMGAAGAMELVVSICALQQSTLPHTAFLDQPDARCEANHVRLPTKPPNDLRAVMSNSFAFGGSNAVLIAKKYED